MTKEKFDYSVLTAKEQKLLNKIKNLKRKQRMKVEEERTKIREANDTFGAILWNIRTKYGWSQNKLAFAVGITPSHFSIVQNGKRGAFNKEVIKKICDTLGVDDEERQKLYAAGAKQAGSPVPFDLEDYVYDNPSCVEFLRFCKKNEADDKFFEALLAEAEEDKRDLTFVKQL